jgi:hypothetical protein
LVRLWQPLASPNGSWWALVALGRRGNKNGKRTYNKAAGLKLDGMDDASSSAITFTPEKTAMVR